MRRRIIIITLAVVAALAVSGGIAYAALTATPTSLSQSTWTLTRLVVDGQEQPLSSTRPATLRFLSNDHQVAGSGGCNMFGASYMLVGSQLRISELRTTLMACAGDDGASVMEQESHYLQALPQVTSYRLGGSTLMLTGDNGRVSLTFRAS
ncbi:MAG TPA: META domain-containing protein [Ktedonobacterales bacterium]|nr:META domain-containing protein [Ktedonobacterales bacterium]